MAESFICPGKVRKTTLCELRIRRLFPLEQLRETCEERTFWLSFHISQGCRLLILFSTDCFVLKSL